MRLTPPVGGFFRRTRRPISLAGVMIPEGWVIQVALAASNQLGSADDLENFRLRDTWKQPNWQPYDHSAV